MDDETKKVIEEQRPIAKLLETEGWNEARAKLVERIMDLQNAFNVDDSDANALVIDIKSRKMATNILYDWLREVEGTKEQYNANKLTLKDKPYMIREDLNEKDLK